MSILKKITSVQVRRCFLAFQFIIAVIFTPAYAESDSQRDSDSVTFLENLGCMDSPLLESQSETSDNIARGPMSYKELLSFMEQMGIDEERNIIICMMNQNQKQFDSYEISWDPSVVTVVYLRGREDGMSYRKGIVGIYHLTSLSLKWGAFKKWNEFLIIPSDLYPVRTTLDIVRELTDIATSNLNIDPNNLFYTIKIN